jgi:hypothetical protein
VTEAAKAWRVAQPILAKKADRMMEDMEWAARQKYWPKAVGIAKPLLAKAVEIGKPLVVNQVAGAAIVAGAAGGALRGASDRFHETAERWKKMRDEDATHRAKVRMSTLEGKQYALDERSDSSTKTPELRRAHVERTKVDPAYEKGWLDMAEAMDEAEWKQNSRANRARWAAEEKQNKKDMTKAAAEQKKADAALAKKVAAERKEHQKVADEEWKEFERRSREPPTPAEKYHQGLRRPSLVGGLITSARKNLASFSLQGPSSSSFSPPPRLHDETERFEQNKQIWERDLADMKARSQQEADSQRRQQQQQQRQQQQQQWQQWQQGQQQWQQPPPPQMSRVEQAPQMVTVQQPPSHREEEQQPPPHEVEEPQPPEMMRVQQKPPEMFRVQQPPEMRVQQPLRAPYVAPLTRAEKARQLRQQQQQQQQPQPQQQQRPPRLHTQPMIPTFAVGQAHAEKVRAEERTRHAEALAEARAEYLAEMEREELQEREETALSRDLPPIVIPPDIAPPLEGPFQERPHQYFYRDKNQRITDQDLRERPWLQWASRRGRYI